MTPKVSAHFYNGAQICHTLTDNISERLCDAGADRISLRDFDGQKLFIYADLTKFSSRQKVFTAWQNFIKLIHWYEGRQSLWATALKVDESFARNWWVNNRRLAEAFKFNDYIDADYSFHYLHLATQGGSGNLAMFSYLLFFDPENTTGLIAFKKEEH